MGIRILIFATMCLIAPVGFAIQPGAAFTDDYLPLLKHKRVALVINHTSLIGTTSLSDSLTSLGVDIRVILTPEHGFEGKAEAGVAIDDGQTGHIPVISLYGSKYKPLPEDLKYIDIIVFDIQDVGVRFYTYISTLHYVMEACAEAGLPLMVLDRPNPNGFYIAGPVLKPDCRSFVGLHPVPVVYGLTIGEYAGMINGEGWLKDGVICPLTIIPCREYTHDSLYQLPVAPSPNLRTMNAVYLYPSLCLFEGTTINVGRGTGFPFEVYGSPMFPDSMMEYTPQDVKGSFVMHQSKKCFGVDLRLKSELLPREKGFTLDYVLSAYAILGKPIDFSIHISITLQAIRK